MRRWAVSLVLFGFVLTFADGASGQDMSQLIVVTRGTVEDVQSVPADAEDVIGVAGKVVDEADRPVAGAQVYLVGTLSGGATDDRGIFWIPVDESGHYEIRTRMFGYGGACARLHLEQGVVPVLTIRAYTNRTELPDEPRDPAEPRERPERCPEVEVPPLDDPPMGR